MLVACFVNRRPEQSDVRIAAAGGPSHLGIILDNAILKGPPSGGPDCILVFTVNAVSSGMCQSRPHNKVSPQIVYNARANPSCLVLDCSRQQ